MSLRLITVDPAHFHAALVHKEMLPGVDPRVSVFAPPGPDLDAHLDHFERFNRRPDNPTRWQVDTYAGADFLPAMLKNLPGDAVVLAGRNRTKIDTMLACVEAGLHVLADKPWIIRHEDFPKLERLIDLAAEKGVVVFDMMTERHEITTILQRELMGYWKNFGTLVTGESGRPSVEMSSVHALKKTVTGAPLRRPVSFFDIEHYGEGLVDVGTHLVDLSLVMIAPGESIDVHRDVVMHSAERWPTRLTAVEYRTITGESPPSDPFDYWCNNRVSYSVRRHRVNLDIRWAVAPPGGDTHQAGIYGTFTAIRVDQSSDRPAPPQLTVRPYIWVTRFLACAGLNERLIALQETYPGIDFSDDGTDFQIHIPDRLRVGHEAHFAQVARDFLRYINEPATMPPWELPNLLAKYFITTKGVEMAREAGGYSTG